MFFSKVELLNYLPFTHCGNKRVAIDFTASCTAFLGGNGSGKSSLLRALTPLPAVRTDYGQNGKIVKVLTHNGSVFELTSDFSNSAAPHSFKKDGVELNIGGTTETQKDLVEEHFGYSKLIADIMSGNMRICTMTKSDRKTLFSSTYPSDLSFVLDYHKKICANIRACGNQLKLLRGREASIKSALIDDNERARLERFRTAATNLIDGIDKAVLILSNEIKSYKAGNCFKEQCHYSYDNWEPLDIRDAIWGLRYDILRGFKTTGIRRKLRDDFRSDNIRILASKHMVTAKVTRDHIEAAVQRVGEIRDELNKFIACKEAAASASEKTQLEERLTVCLKEFDEVTKLIGSSEVGLLNADKIDTIESQFLPYVKDWIDNFHSGNVHVMPWQAVSDLGIRLEHSKVATGSEIRNALIEVTNELAAVKERLDKLRSKSYPKDCKSICPLRDAVSETISNTESRFNQLVERKRDLLKQSEDLKAFVELNAPIYRTQVECHQNIGTLIQGIQGLGLEGVAFGGEDPVDVCNDHIYDIYNRISRACELTRLWKHKTELGTEIEAIQQTLKEMANAKQLVLSEELIENTIKDREEKLNHGIQEIEQLESFAAAEEAKGQAIEKIGQNYEELEYRVRDAYHMMNHWRVEDLIKFDERLIADLTAAKHDLSAELYGVSQTLDDQRKHLDILESEILPTTRKVEKEKRLYEMVADGLSPTSGLPCIYLIRFINRLLKRANEIIHDVWLYDMDLVYLKEEEELDFQIPVLFRNSTMAKDISLCSMGQQAIVNFALNLALCIERGYFEKYPFSFDECDAPLTESHRTRLTSLLSDLLDKQVIKQMFLVNHFAVQSGLSQCDCVVLHPEGIILPEVYNSNAEVE